MLKGSAVYECDIKWDPEEEEVSVFDPTVSFTGPNGHKFHLGTRDWNRMGQPQKIKVTVEALNVAIKALNG